MGELSTDGPGLELDDLFGGPMVYIPEAPEPDEDASWMAFAEGAMGYQSASSSASQ